MAERPVDTTTEPYRAEDGNPDARGDRHSTKAGGAADSVYDATWTERVLNSLVAGGRRKRGMVRRAHTDAESYAAYDTAARPVVATATGQVDQGTVELALNEDKALEQEALRGQRAATTVLLRRRRPSWWWAALALTTTTGGLGAIWMNRHVSRSAAAQGAAATVPPGLFEAASSPPAGATASADRAEASPPIASVRARARSEPPKRELPPRSIPPAPSPSSGPAQGGPKFVDVVNRY